MSKFSLILLSASVLFLSACGDSKNIDVTEPNTAPIATAQNITMEEGISKTITLSGTDAENDVLIFIIVTPPSHGTFNGTTYTPKAGYRRSDSFTFRANDGKANSTPATISITITEKAEIINGYVLPPEPDESVNNSTLLGIDSNDNGVRDDVERWIIKTYKNNHKIVTEAAMQNARAFKKILVNPSMAKETRKYMEDAHDCRSYYQRWADMYGEKKLIPKSVKIYKESRPIILNTRKRSRAYREHNLALSGGVYSLRHTDILKSKCDFDIDRVMESMK